MTYLEIGALHEKLDVVINALSVSSGFTSPIRTISQASTIMASGHRVVPGLLSRHFVGRHNELKWLQEKLEVAEEVVGGCVGIYGTTGLGKTQLMLAYERSHAHIYYNQFFLNAGSMTKLSASCYEVLEELDLAADASPDDHATIKTFFRSLMKMSNWLLLIDNVGQEEVDTIRQLLPIEIYGHVIISSQQRLVIENLVQSAHDSLEIKKLDPDEAIQIFIASGYEPLKSSKELATEIVKEVGLLPHAIEQVASYIKVNNLDLQTFLNRYRRTPNQVLEWNDGYTHHRQPVAKHFSMILQTLEESHSDALEVLKFYSLLEPEAIPLFDVWGRTTEEAGFDANVGAKSVQQRGKFKTCACWPFDSCFAPRQNNEATVKIGRLEEVFRNETAREAAIGKLWDLNLVRRVDNNPKLLWMHDLTKLAARASVLAANTDLLITQGISVMYHMFPLEDTTAIDRAWVELCLPQCGALIKQAKARAIPVTQYVGLLALSGQANVSHGAVVTGMSQLEEAKPIYVERLGSENTRTILLIQKLAQANKFAGNMKRAEELYRQALILREKISGREASETLEVMNDLASLIERAGRLKEAELIFESLYKRHKARGQNSPTTMAAAHNLGLCYHNQGRLNEAERMYQIALGQSEIPFGIEDVGSLKTLSNLAATVDHQGRLDEAQSLYEKALPSFIKVLGFDHFLTIRLRGNMAGLRRQQGAFKQAEDMIKGCLEVVTKLYGPDNFETITVLYDLGEVLHAKGDFLAANQAYEKAIGLCVGDLENHPVVFRFLDAAGLLKREMGHLKAAEDMSRKGYDRFQQMLGWDDPYTLVAANDYAELLHAQGKYDEARDMYAKCLVSLERLVGKCHPHYLMVTNNLGRICLATGTNDPLVYFDEAYQGFKSLVGPDHFCTLTIALNQARCWAVRGDFEHAHESIETVQKKLQFSIGDRCPLTLACELIQGLVAATRGEPGSLVLAKEYLTNAVERAQQFGADYFLGLCLLVLILKQLEVDEDTIRRYSTLLDPSSTAIQGLSPWFLPGHGTVSVSDLLSMDPKEFHWTNYIPLAIGENVRLRWGRKCCWREADKTQIIG
ncbi:hypothetical protein F5B22DRAFT_280682 [Xylaria bambusicola]|uniref:uncharacterized protein n=1 Tax=Xylaria bambusicola TaxID=326684 RepID=UPI002007D733|nr:uncharacterized protein F5B22DRAFT_280682 [Xylaria bambusicola]KAI0513225.1 hypothetical protein F5B22DRAFT_280682 [Xylaria bambusicola]